MDSLSAFGPENTDRSDSQNLLKDFYEEESIDYIENHLELPIEPCSTNIFEVKRNISHHVPRYSTMRTLVRGSSLLAGLHSAT